MGIIRKLRSMFGMNLRDSGSGSLSTGHDLPPLPSFDDDCCKMNGLSTSDPGIRERLRDLSEDQDNCNPYYNKALSLHASMVIGSGPQLAITDRRISQSDAQDVYYRWRKWCKASGFAGAMREIRRGAMKSGEGLGLMVTAERQRDPVKLKLKSIDASRLASPMRTGEEIKDGIRYDDNGDPVEFWLQDGAKFDPKPYEADEVIYYYNRCKEEQCRGIPELHTSLKVFPKINSYRNAVVSAQELFARMPMALEVDAVWVDDNDRENDLSPKPEDKPFALPRNGTLVPTMPKGTQLKKLQGEAPGTNSDAFLRGLVTEAVSPICMPALLIMGDAGNSSFSSANIDWEPYVQKVMLDREDMELSATRVFDAWLEEAALIPGYLPDSVRSAIREDQQRGELDLDHEWRWPRVKCHIDPRKEASARQIDLQSCSMTLLEVYEQRSEDLEYEIQRMAKLFGKTPEEVKRVYWEKFQNRAKNQTQKSGSQSSSARPAA